MKQVNKKIIVFLLKLIPIVSTLISLILLITEYDSNILDKVSNIAIILSFFGFIFFFIGRKLSKEDKTIKILGILDLVATIYVVVLYTIVIFIFGL